MSNKLDSEDYYQIMRCLDHCIEDMMKLRFIATTEWERLTNLKFKCEQAYNAALKIEEK